MTLGELEAAIRRAVPSRSKVNVIRYPDDSVTTGMSQELMRDKVLPVVRTFVQAKTKEIIRNYRGKKTAGMIGKLNSVLRG